MSGGHVPETRWVAGLRLLTCPPLTDGPARMLVVLLPGAALPAELWQYVPGLLPQDLVVAVDRAGRGAGSAQGVSLLREQVRRLLHALDGLRAQPGAERAPVLLVAHSMAAFEAEAVARLRPGLVSALVLVDPSLAVAHRLPRPWAAWRLSRSSVPALPAACQAVVRLALRVPPLHLAASRLLLTALRRQLRRPEALDWGAWRRAWETPGGVASRTADLLSYSGQLADLVALRRRRGSTPVPVPTVLLEAAPTAGAAQVRDTCRAFSCLTVRHVRGSGHLMSLDAPEQVARAVEDLWQVLQRRRG